MAIFGQVFIQELASSLQELAQTVVATHHAAVQYKSTDRVLKYPEFQELCLKVVTPESVLVVEQYLRQQHLIAKAGTEKDGEVYMVRCMATVFGSDDRSYLKKDITQLDTIELQGRRRNVME